MIPYGRQDIDDDDVAAVVATLRSDFLTQGPAVTAFEAALCRYVGSSHAVAVCNATAALHLAYRALGLAQGDILWTSPNTFLSTANAGLFCGAEVDFVDIDPNTYLMDPGALARKLSAARQMKRLPKIVAPVHFAGQSCDMKAIRGLSGEFGFKIVEDASHAIGADHESAKVGSCAYSDLAVFSFHPVKIITTGEGGAIMGNDPALAAHMRELRSHGMTRERSRMQGESEGAWRYEQIDLGYNYRLTDLQASLGSSQLQRLDRFIERRRRLAARYDERLHDLPLVTPAQNPQGRSAFHLYPIRLRLDRLAKSRKEIFDALRAAGVGVNVHYIPVHLQPYYAKFGFRRGDFPESERYYDAAITLPLFAAMTDEQQDEVVHTVTSILRACLR